MVMMKFVFSAISLEGPCLLTVPQEKKPGYASSIFLPNPKLAIRPKMAPKNMVRKA